MSVVDQRVGVDEDEAGSDVTITEERVSTDNENGSVGVAILRITLGVIILATWFSNITSDPNFYSAEGLRGFFDWVFDEENGNGASLTFIGSLFDAIDDAGLLGAVGFAQIIGEFLIGAALVAGVFTRFFSALAFAFFTGLFLTYFGGEEWIFTYVILMASAVTTFLSWGGRKLGVDQTIAASRGDSPGKLLW